MQFNNSLCLAVGIARYLLYKLRYTLFHPPWHRVVCALIQSYLTEKHRRSRWNCVASEDYRPTLFHTNFFQQATLWDFPLTMPNRIRIGHEFVMSDIWSEISGTGFSVTRSPFWFPVEHGLNFAQYGVTSGSGVFNVLQNERCNVALGLIGDSRSLHACFNGSQACQIFIKKSNAPSIRYR